MANLKYLIDKLDFAEWYYTNGYNSVVPFEYLMDTPITMIWGILIEWFSKHSIVPVYTSDAIGIIIFNEQGTITRQDWYDHELKSDKESMNNTFNLLIGFALDEIYERRTILEEREAEF